MNRNVKLLIQVALIFIMLLLGFAAISHLQFDMSAIDYLRYSRPLTQEEEAWLEEKETIIYGMDWKQPPLTFINEENNQKEGLLIDYMSALSIELGVNVTYDATSFNHIMDSLDQGHIDMSDLFESPERLKKYTFTHPLYRLRGIAVTNANRTDLQSVSELKNITIALVEDDFAVEHFNLYFPEDSFGNTYIMVKDMHEGLQLLQNQEVDALAGDDTVINYYASQLGLKEEIREIGTGLYEKNVTFAVRKDDHILLSILNKGILSLKKKNILIQAQSKWFDTSAPVITDINAMRWLPLTVAAALIIILGFFIWQSMMDRKIAERTREIQLQKDNQRTIIDNIHSMLLVVDKKKRIADANQQAIRTLGNDGDAQSLIGRHVDDVPLLQALLHACSKESSDKVHTFQGRYYTIFAQPLNAIDGSQLIVIEDHTEKTLTEKRLRQESKMSAVGQLSAGLAHEIRNPLGLIKNYTYFLHGSGEEDEITEHAIQVISDSTDRINRLIENLLKFSRLGDERISNVDLYQLVQNLAVLEHKKMEKAGIQFTVTCEENTYFLTSEETLKIALINLINNAVDALSGVNSNQQKRIDCQISAAPEELQISVSDNGPGISEAHLDSLFNPFFTTKDNGTGLGLYTVSSELEKLGGNIQLDSEYLCGARFVIKIPANQEVKKHEEPCGI